MNTPRRTGVLCVGRIYCDLVFTGVPNLPRNGEETFAQGLSTHAGGGAFITAATIKALGGDVSLFATLPAKPFDAVITRDMKRTNLSMDYCKAAPPDVGPQITVATVFKGDRAFLTHCDGPALPDANLPVGPWIHLHVGELRTLVENPDLIKQSKSAGMTLSVDCSWDEELLQNPEHVSELLSHVDVFLPNETEYNHLKQFGWSEENTPLTVIKRGSSGSNAYNEGRWFNQAAQDTTVVDTTGAGDAFNGGFLLSWLGGDALSTSLAVGNHCGAASIAGVGGTGGLSALSGRLSELRANHV